MSSSCTSGFHFWGIIVAIAFPHLSRTTIQVCMLRIEGYICVIKQAGRVVPYQKTYSMASARVYVAAHVPMRFFPFSLEKRVENHSCYPQVCPRNYPSSGGTSISSKWKSLSHRRIPTSPYIRCFKLALVGDTDSGLLVSFRMQCKQTFFSVRGSSTDSSKHCSAQRR